MRIEARIVKYLNHLAVVFVREPGEEAWRDPSTLPPQIKEAMQLAENHPFNIVADSIRTIEDLRRHPSVLGVRMQGSHYLATFEFSAG